MAWRLIRNETSPWHPSSYSHTSGIHSLWISESLRFQEAYLNSNVTSVVCFFILQNGFISSILTATSSISKKPTTAFSLLFSHFPSNPTKIFFTEESKTSSNLCFWISPFSLNCTSFRFHFNSKLTLYAIVCRDSTRALPTLKLLQLITLIIQSHFRYVSHFLSLINFCTMSARPSIIAIDFPRKPRSNITFHQVIHHDSDEESDKESEVSPFQFPLIRRNYSERKTTEKAGMWLVAVLHDARRRRVFRPPRLHFYGGPRRLRNLFLCHFHSGSCVFIGLNCFSPNNDSPVFMKNFQVFLILRDHSKQCSFSFFFEANLETSVHN